MIKSIIALPPPEFNRRSAEAHLSLSGWRALAWGSGGAGMVEEGLHGETFLLVYTFHAPGVGKLQIAEQWNKRRNEIGDRWLDDWIFLDEIFWPIFNNVLQRQRCKHPTQTAADGKPNPYGMRCQVCQQLAY